MHIYIEYRDENNRPKKTKNEIKAHQSVINRLGRKKKTTQRLKILLQNQNITLAIFLSHRHIELFRSSECDVGRNR